jgi:hypothetical protein
VSDPNKQLMDLLKIPANAGSATLRMRMGRMPMLTVISFFRHDELGKPVLATHRYKLCPADDDPVVTRKRDRRGELDTTSLDDEDGGCS